MEMSALGRPLVHTDAWKRIFANCICSNRAGSATPGKPVAERAACTIPTIIARWTSAPFDGRPRTGAAVRDRAENPWG